MGLYTKNGASPGSMRPPGYNAGNQLTRATGVRPAGQRAPLVRPNLQSLVRPGASGGRTPAHGQLQQSNLAMSPIAPPSTQPVQPATTPLWDSSALMQAAMARLEAQQTLRGFDTKIAGLKQGWDSGTSQYHTRFNKLNANQQRDKFASHGSLAGRGILNSGMRNWGEQDIKESYVPQYDDVEKSYGQSAIDQLGLDRKKAGQDVLWQILSILGNSYTGKLPEIPEF